MSAALRCSLCMSEGRGSYVWGLLPGASSAGTGAPVTSSVTEASGGMVAVQVLAGSALESGCDPQPARRIATIRSPPKRAGFVGDGAMGEAFT